MLGWSGGVYLRPTNFLVDSLVCGIHARGDTNMALTDLAIKRALLGAKTVKLSDGGGLQLWITPEGAKRWRVAYASEDRRGPSRWAYSPISD